MRNVVIRLLNSLFIMFFLAVIPLDARATDTSCQIKFENWIVKREPAGYAINPATLAVFVPDKCIVRKRNTGDDTVILVKNVSISIDDKITGKRAQDKTSISITLDKHHHASVYIDYFALNVDYSSEGITTMRREGNDLSLANTRPITAPDVAPQHYVLAPGGKIILFNWFSQ
ncbi:hypothetical protein [Cedecea sp. NFIX57]|uniref:hypothetical protein n=1 Tax=Cedecea sp. NFIX57 TaxID=1566286 RepID=UPI000A0A081F|nr:hypothetical protein [Cedecea sp. NFIX57]SMG61680.1 hypothetical protein SAMN03159353_105217 [Cedecea sp. NFIX57]